MVKWIYIVDRSDFEPVILQSDGSRNPLTAWLDEAGLTRGRFAPSSIETPAYREAPLYKSNGWQIGRVHRIGIG